MMVVVLAGWDVQESLAVGGVAVGVDHCGGCDVVVVRRWIGEWEECVVCSRRE
jgi:hypothetical protein